jgi:hypothetical protein
MSAAPLKESCTAHLTLLQEEIKEANAKAIVLSGGPNSVHVEGAPRLPDGFFEYVEGERLVQRELAAAKLSHGCPDDAEQDPARLGGAAPEEVWTGAAAARFRACRRCSGHS